MSIRIVNIVADRPGNPAPGLLSGEPSTKWDPFDLRYINPGVGNSIREEAAPFYASASTQLVITTPSGDTTFYAAWARVPVVISGTAASGGNGLDRFSSTTPTGTDCNFLAGFETFAYTRDARKQRFRIVATAQFITAALPGGGTTGRSISPPQWILDSGTSPRLSYRYFGQVAGSGLPDIAADMSTLTDAQWRDMRGTYSASYTSGTTTYAYTWVIG